MTHKWANTQNVSDNDTNEQAVTRAISDIILVTHFVCYDSNTQFNDKWRHDNRELKEQISHFLRARSLQKIISFVENKNRVVLHADAS